MPAPITRSLARFVSELSLSAVPAAAVPIVRCGFTDFVAVMLAGIDEPVAAMIRDFIPSRGRTGEASLYLGGEFATAPDAALANSVAGHALDYDDVALAGHPSVVLVPAILAEAEALGSGGAAAVAAYVAGYEVWARLLEREPDALHRKGWHPTAVLGPVAAAAAAANLRRLDPARSAHALAMAASMSAGLVANFGTMTKPLQAGRAAASGVTAARLAAAGLTAAEDALEHPQGLLAALSPHGRVDTETPLSDLGREFRILAHGLSIKKYPMCYGTHRVIDGMLDLVAANDLRPEGIAEIEVTTGKAQAAMLRNHRPRTGLEAKFSMEFAVASSLVARAAGLEQLTDGFVRRPEVQALFPRIRLATNDTVAPDDPAFSAYDSLRLKLAGGGELAMPEIRAARGHWTLPLSAEELWTKFRDCARQSLPEPAIRPLFDRLQGIETLESVAGLRSAAADRAVAS